MSNNRNFTHNSNFTFNTNLFGESTTYAIQAVNLPGVSFNHISANRSSMMLNFQGDTLNFNDLNISLIVDENLIIWKDLMNKIFKMREQKKGTGSSVEEMSWIEIQDDNSNKILKIEFYGCMISSVDDLDYNTTSEDEIIALPVTLTYDYYIIV